jgi:hypothetical protein
MPSRRYPLRRRRHPPIDSETLALFLRLDAVKRKARRSAAFKRDQEALAQALDLLGELRFGIASVLDADLVTPRPPKDGHANIARAVCLEARQALLRAAGLRELTDGDRH